MSNIIKIPEFVTEAMSILEKNNFKAYCVGGCIRDIILKREQHDWDLCTDALPDEISKCFTDAGYNVARYLNKNGTVFVKKKDVQNLAIEITTYKSGCTLDDDLNHRDFTMNSMACNKSGVLYDPHSGLSSIDTKMIFTTGDPVDRFTEDPLRILRAIRFAATLGFTINSYTSQNMNHCARSLSHVASERIFSELCKILLSNNSTNLLMEYKRIIVTIIPQFKPCVRFNQNNPAHDKDIYDHMMYTVDCYKGDDLAIKLALFLHDIGKPNCYTIDENKIGHFYGHPEVSKQIAQNVLLSLHCSISLIKEVCQLIEYHDNEIGLSKKSINKLINKIGYETFLKLLEVKRADALGHTKEICERKLEYLEKIKDLLEQIKQDYENKAAVFEIKDLAINGHDLIEMGLEEGPYIGMMLKSLLMAVINEEIENTYEACVKFVDSHLIGINDKCYKHD